jgi:hypothetical protein
LAAKLFVRLMGPAKAALGKVRALKMLPLFLSNTVAVHLDQPTSPLGTGLTSICTATIPSVDAGPTDVGDAHREVSVRAAQRPTFYGVGAVVLRLAEPSNAH